MTLPIHLLCHRSFFVFRLPTSTVERDASIIHENVLARYALALFSSKAVFPDHRWRWRAAVGDPALHIPVPRSGSAPLPS